MGRIQIAQHTQRRDTNYRAQVTRSREDRTTRVSCITAFYTVTQPSHINGSGQVKNNLDTVWTRKQRASVPTNARAPTRMGGLRPCPTAY